MADVNANIGVNIDTSLALAQLKSLQRQISQFHTSIARSSQTSALAQKSLQKNFLDSVNAIGSFSAELRTVKTTTESFTASLEGNKFSMREYFRFAGGATKTFGKLFKSEFETIGKVAQERVKRLQTQYIKMGRDASGAMQAVAITPTTLNMQDYGTKTAIAAQKQALFNQLMKQGSTNLLNFGKNTQWAGRQLMVGFTIPLAMVGSAATKTFMEMEAQAIKFKKVYGDLFTPGEETKQALEDITELGRSFTKYGVAVSTTVDVAAEAAAAGFSGLDLQRQTTEATRLSILGQIDTQKALETTISLQNAFGMSSDKLADSINFLNAVENQTVVSLDDITTAIPKVAPVVQQLGGDIKDLTFFITAMKEGGINASEGANALKSGLAALINPTGKASAMLESFGINARKIVVDNKGDLKATVIEFATALNQLDPLNRAQAIEQMFGKFQFARLSTLFANVTKEGNQASRVLDLANSSVEELSSLSEKELGLTAESSMNKFKKSVEDLKFALIPVGEAFLKAVTPIVEFVGNVLEKFGNLSDGTKKAITVITVAIGAIGPIALMAFGLLANGAANIIKLFLTLRNGYLRLTGQSQILGDQTQYLTMEQIEAAAASHSLNQAHATLTQQFTAEAGAVAQLIAAYQAATRAGAAFAMANPGAMIPRGKGYANGVVSVPGSGSGDTVPAMLTPGEAVIPAAMAKKYAPLISGMVAGNIPGYRTGRIGRSASGGELSQRNVIGGYQLSHVGDVIKLTGQQLLDLAKSQSQSVSLYMDNLVNSTEGGLTRMFELYNNFVTVQSKELNQQVGETGSGKTASVDLFRRDAVTRSADYNAPILSRMKEAGASEEELQKALSELTSELTSGVDDLGDITTVTAEDINRITKAAYEKVAETNLMVKNALEEMNQPGALKEVVSSGKAGRTPLSGGYNTATQKKKVSSMVQDIGSGAYPAQQAFNFTGEAARELGVKNAEELGNIYDKLSQEAKIRIQEYLGDIKKMSEQVIIEAEKAGVNIGEHLIVGISQGTRSESPSRDAIQEGKNVVDGLEIGMEQGKSDVLTAGKNLGDAAISGTQNSIRTRRVATAPQGAPSTVLVPDTQNARRVRAKGPVTAAGGTPEEILSRKIRLKEVQDSAAISEQLQQKTIEQARATVTATERLRGLDRNIMGASFAISSLSGLASMSGGKLGAMSGTISKVTGAMFALQAITSLLTQTKIMELAASRLAIAKQATAFATYGKGISSKAGLLGSFARVGLGITKFLGPIGIATTVATGLYVGMRFLQKQQEKARLAIEGLGDAALLSSDKIKTLADFFGVTPTKTKLETTGPSLILNKEQRSQVDTLRGTESFQKDFGKDIQSLKGATNKQAEIIFNSLKVQLKGKGFAQDQIKTIIQALQEESGKTKVEINFANIDLNTKGGQKEVQDIASTLGKSFGRQFEKGYKEVTFKNGQTLSSMSDGLKKNLSTTSKTIAGLFNGLSGQITNQAITADKFNEAFAGISETIGNMPEPQSMLLLDNILKSMPGDLAKTAIGIKNVSDQLLIAKAAALGVSTITPVMIKQLKTASESNDSGAARAAARVRQKVSSDIKAIQGLFDLVKKESEAAAYVPGGGGDGKKSAFQIAKEQLQDQRNELINTTKAYKMLTDAGFDAETALKYASDPVISLGLATKNIKITQVKELVDLIGQIGPKIESAGVREFFTKLGSETKLKEELLTIIPQLSNMGLKLEDINNVLQNPDLVSYLSNPLLTAEQKAANIKRYIDRIAAQKAIDIKFNLSTPEGQEQQFSDMKSKAMEYFDILERSVQDKFEDPIKAAEKAAEKAADAVKTIQDEIDVLQNNSSAVQRKIEEQINRPLEALQARSAILSETSTLIDKQADGINAKYDAQAEALTKISEINSDIADQQKQQLGLADALSRGDIAAAAAAAQEMRATAAAKATQKSSGVLDIARQQALDNITVNGMTKKQIDAEQYNIERRTFVLEQARIPFTEEIRNIEDSIYNIQVGKLATAQATQIQKEKDLTTQQDFLKAELDTIDAQRERYEDAQLALDVAKVKSEEFQTALKANDTIVGAMVKKWNDMQDKKLTVTITEIRNIVSGGSGGGGASSQTKMYGGKIMAMSMGGMVPKYMAAGGRVGSDTVPAMLTPGEFVMNKAATKRFGPMLENMNNSKYPSMIKDLTPTTYNNVSSSMITPIMNSVSSSVTDNSSTLYNYSVGINVNESSASSNDIARAVIGQIKYIDSQRIRGQR